jgi:hypothetical protein
MGFVSSKFSNPADVFMKVLSINYPKKDEDNQKIEMLVSSYKTHQMLKVQ